MIRYYSVVVGVLMFAFGAWAQSSPPSHDHQATAPKLIDGAAHPELIPDSIAYRLYLLAVSTGQNPTEAEQKGQRAHLMQAGLTDADQQILTSILSDFRSKYDTLVAEYNDSARAAFSRNELTDIRILLNKLDDLVQATRDTINVRLTSRGAARLHLFVRSEKKNMKVQED